MNIQLKMAYWGSKFTDLALLWPNPVVFVIYNLLMPVEMPVTCQLWAHSEFGQWKNIYLSRVLTDLFFPWNGFSKTPNYCSFLFMCNKISM